MSPPPHPPQDASHSPVYFPLAWFLPSVSACRSAAFVIVQAPSMKREIVTWNQCCHCLPGGGGGLYNRHTQRPCGAGVSIPVCDVNVQDSSTLSRHTPSSISLYLICLCFLPLSCVTFLHYLYPPPHFGPISASWALKILADLSALRLSPGLHNDNGVLCFRTQVQRLNRDDYFKRVQLVSLRHQQDS